MQSRLNKIAAAIATIMLSTSIFAANSASPVGLWKTIDDVTNKPKSILRISESNGELQGTIVKSFPTDANVNGICVGCAGKFHNKRLEGMTIMSGLKPEANNPGTWSGGKITDPLTAKTYKCTITVTNGGSSLDVRGYIGIQLLGRTQTWVRTK